MSGQQQRSGATAGRPWTPAELAVLAPLAATKRAPEGSVLAAAQEIGRPITAVYVALSQLRRGVRKMPAVAPAPAPPPKRATFQNGVPWSAAEMALLLPLVDARPRPGQLQVVERQLGRTRAAVHRKLADMRSWTAEELAAATCAPAPMREAPRADGSGHGVTTGLLPTLTAAVQAHAPRTVSSAAGAASEAAPAVRSGWHGSMQSKLHLAELRAEHPPERVARRCMACRTRFLAPSRFRFRCDGCLASHKHATGYDA